MVATASTQRFFRKAAAEGEENTNEWHAYRDDGNTALCGEAQLTYNVDSIADAVPQTGTLHLGCREALAVEQQPQAEAEAAAAAEAQAAEAAATGEAEGGEATGEGDPADAGTETQTVTGDEVADLNATLGEGVPEASAEETPAETPVEEAPAETPAEVIDGDDGTAATPEPDPVP